MISRTLLLFLTFTIGRAAGLLVLVDETRRELFGILHETVLLKNKNINLQTFPGVCFPLSVIYQIFFFFSWSKLAEKSSRWTVVGSRCSLIGV